MKGSEQAPQQNVIVNTSISNTEALFKLSVTDLLLDLKVLMKEYYCGTFTEDEKGLKLQFLNGQRFIMSLREIL